MQSPRTPFTADLRAVIQQAQREAAQRHSVYLDVEHLLLGLLRHPSGSAYDLLRERGADAGALYARVAGAVGVERGTPIEVKGYSRSARAVLERAAQEAGSLGHPAVDAGHLLLGLMSEPDGAVQEALAAVPLAAEDVRAYLRSRAAPAPAANPRTAAPRPRAAPPSAAAGSEFVVVPVRPSRARPKDGGLLARWGNRLWIIAALAGLLAYLVFVLPGSSLFTFGLVLAGWIFSVTLHEFAHALVAYLGGDFTVRDKGYLSFNPLKYTHPMLSIGMPLLFLALGGIGLPGGAVYIERHRLKNKWWGAAVSAAGPAANLLLAIVLAAPFALGLVKTDLIEFRIWLGQTSQAETIWENATVWSAVAFLAMLQITAVIFNLLPIPPLDGFGILEPFVDERTRRQLLQFGTFGIFLVFMALWFVPPLANAFWDMIFQTTHALQLPDELIREGFRNFMFWRNPP